MTTDKGERELRKWALRRNGDPVTNEDVVSLVFAFADDFDEMHGTTLAMFEEAKSERESICARIILLEEWREVQASTCKDRVTALIEAEHDKRHGDHMKEHHSDDAGFQQRFIWWWGGKIGYLVLAALVTIINLALNYLWFGRP